MMESKHTKEELKKMSTDELLDLMSAGEISLEMLEELSDSKDTSTPKPKADTPEGFLLANYDFKHNEVKGLIEWKKKKDKKYSFLTDRDLNSIYLAIKRAGIKVHKHEVDTIIHSDFTPVYNPFKSYFNNLPHRTGTETIDKLASKVTVREGWDEYFRKCLTKWMVGAVACSINEDHVNQTVLIFQGHQGSQKSTFFSRLVPQKLHDYQYGGTLSPNNKDTMIYLAECFIINLDELATLTKKGEAEMKEVITKPSITVRRPYDKHPQTVPRRASFVGSVNEDQILSDSTGSRRYLIIPIEKIDADIKHLADDAWAEAFTLYNEGFDFYFHMDDIREVNKKNQMFAIESPEEVKLLEHFQPADEDDGTAQELTSTEIFEIIYPKKSSSRSRSDLIRLGLALKKRDFSFRILNGLKKYRVHKTNKTYEKSQDSKGMFN